MHPKSTNHCNVTKVSTLIYLKDIVKIFPPARKWTSHARVTSILCSLGSLLTSSFLFCFLFFFSFLSFAILAMVIFNKIKFFYILWQLIEEILLSSSWSWPINVDSWKRFELKKNFYCLQYAYFKPILSLYFLFF